MKKRIQKQHSITTTQLLTGLAVFVLFGIVCLTFQYTKDAITNLADAITPIPTATSVPLPASLEEIKTGCPKGECVAACLAHVNQVLKQQEFNLPEYHAEDADLVYYGISKTDELEKPRNFKVTGDLLSLRQNTDAHKIIWSYFKGLFPSETRPDLVTFGIYASSTSDGKFDTTLTENWIMKINILSLEDAQYLSGASVHEYGHYLTLNITQRDKERNKSGYCKQKPLYFCQTPDSYLNLFYLEFWEDIYPEWADIDQDSTSYENTIRMFYEKYKNRFINDYAATDPIEDVAESWTAFVLEPVPAGDTVAEQKARFFSKFPELVQLRYQIIKGICTFNGIPQDQ
jgi:hypothetical protein